MVRNTAELEYEAFLRYFIEIADYLKGLTKEKRELDSKGEQVPLSLSNEIFRHEIIINILTQAGERMYNKTQEQLYSDGERCN